MFFFEVLQPLSPELFWILCLAFIIAFLLAFSVGANDVSNSFGTSVGSRVLTVTQACILATIFEMAGATLLGYSVCDTFRRKMYDVSQYEGAQKELMLGALACLIGSASWNIVATTLKMPISGTHSIVGATIGFSIVLRGWDSIRWIDMMRIVISWFVSPLLSGIISSLIYTIISKTIIRKIDPLRHGLKALPLFYGVTIFINVASVVIDGPEVFGLNTLPWYAGLFIALVCASIAICCVALIWVPKLRNEILDELADQRKKPKPKPLAPIRVAPEPKKSVAVTTKTTTTTTTTTMKSPLNYDNQAFKSDEQINVVDQKQKQAPEKPMRGMANQPASDEITLDPAKLEQTDSTVAPQADGKRPKIAPKPAHLRRQRARELSRDSLDGGELASKRQDFDEIDLSKDGVEVFKSTVLDMRVADTPIKPIVQTPAQGSEPGEQVPGSMGERHEIARLFASLQILTACFASFAHGTNDVSNAVAPLIPIWNIYTSGEENVAIPTQVWILAFGSIGICTGLWAWGRAVMGTISDGITKITPSKGFSIELGAAISVLVATKLGLPISTTHCKVGSLVIVGFVSQKFLSKDKILDTAALAEQQKHQTMSQGVSQQLQIIDDRPSKDDDPEAVDWKMFGNIAVTWISTVPLAALASAIVMYVLKWTLL